MIIFINGSTNSGKSSVAKLLASKIENTALLEVDSLREMISLIPIEQAIQINLENAASLIKNFCKRGMNVLVVYPLSRENYEYLIDILGDVKIDKLFFTLSPEIDTVLSNRGSRELKENEIERIRYHYEIGINNPDFGEVIDNTKQTVDETADYILSKINGIS